MPSILSEDDKRLADRLLAFGCPGIVPLRRSKAESPDQIPYLDLLAKHVRETAPLLPDAVAEFQGRPVMYFLDAMIGEPDSRQRLDLQQRLANRGDQAVLAVVRPGDLTLYPLHLDRDELDKNGIGKVVTTSDPKAPFLFSTVADGMLDLPGQSEAADPVFAEIQKLLKRAVEDLVGRCGMEGLEVLSLVGRALFFRFLIDRRIVEIGDLSEICPSAAPGALKDLLSVFSTAEMAADASVWLDQTFNGDLLPLINTPKETTPTNVRRLSYKKAYQNAGSKTQGLIFRHLEAILRGWEQMNGVTQLKLPIDWDDLNFRHIPIGVLSQVYEDFSHQVDRRNSLDRSVHYTPRTLAKLLVDQALGGLDAPHEARILDPSCGAGVFLVLALRELVRLRWEYDRKLQGEKARRPGKPVIQGILYRQICGFDISESALRLAALALYVTVIELNEITRPPSEHHAGKALHDLVLFDQRALSERAETGFVTGSLSDTVSRERFDGAFDIVLGNPPWTRLDGAAKEKIDFAGTAIARRVLTAKGLENLATEYQNPGGVPDIPFLWRAMEWAKPRGIIAFALDARLILAQSGPGTKARNALLQAVSVTGILNGSDLEKTAVWASHDQPWILLWARNERPEPTHAFHLLTPVRENELSERGLFRLDYQSAYPVLAKKIIECSWMCKALALGTSFDVQIMEKLVTAAKRQSIGSFWGDNKLPSGNGFSLKNGTKLAPEWLLKLPVFEPAGKQLPLAGINSLQSFGEKYPNRKIESARSPNLYRKPLVIIPETPGENRSTPQAYNITTQDVSFSKSFYGYTGANHSKSTLILSLLTVLVHSTLFRHFCYMRSPRVGAGRRTIYKDDVDAFPYPKLEELSDFVQQEAIALARSLSEEEAIDWAKIDTFTCRLFGLTKSEQQVVSDTVSFNGPYRSVREPAGLPVPPVEIAAFARTLEQSLQPFFKVAHQKVRVSEVPRAEEGWLQPWRFLTVLLENDTWTPSSIYVASLLAEASKAAASRLVMHLPEGGLIVGLLNKRRFWTKTRARLCALHIAHEHLDKSFPIPSLR